MKTAIVLCSMLWLLAPALNANDAPSALPTLPALDTLPKVEPEAGEKKSEPPLWKVTHTNGHVLWLLGTVNPKPKGFKWRSQAVGRAIAGSQLVLRQSNEMPAGIAVELYTLDPLQHMRAALHEGQLEDSRDEKTLKQVLSPELYSRFDALRKEYLERSHSIEKQSPVAAANRLYNAAIAEADLSTRASIHDEVERLARKHDVDIESITLEIKVNLRTAMEIETERSEQPLSAEVPCMQMTVELLETHIPTMTARANAWANGDLKALREMPNLTRNACNYAPWSAPRWKDLPQRLAQHWLDTVEAAVKEHRSTFVMIDLAQLLKPDGLLTALESKGYRVEAP
jgi:uncharacterized protein YbaP (TraB family)